MVTGFRTRSRTTNRLWNGAKSPAPVVPKRVLNARLLVLAKSILSKRWGMADAVPIEKLRQSLRELKPEAKSLLAAELERALARGEAPPGAEMILAELRGEARGSGRSTPRPGNPQRLFLMPLEP